MIEKNSIFFHRWSVVGGISTDLKSELVGVCSRWLGSGKRGIGKVASIDWTIGKFLNIVLLVLVLVLVVYGVSTQSLIPLKDNIESKFNEVWIMFDWKDDVAFRECYSESVVNLGGGKEFLKAIGMEGEDVVLNVCRNRMCNVSGEGLGDYRTIEGSFEKFDGENWKEYDSVFVGNMDSAKFNWELYDAGVDILDKPEIKRLYDEGFTKQFILYGDGSGVNEEVYAIWQNGEWRVREGDPKSASDGWFKSGNEFMRDGWMVQKWKRKTMIGLFEVGEIKTYTTKDDDEAINVFANIVWKSKDIDDDVYWRETIPTISNVEYLSGFDHGEIVMPVAGSGWSFEADDNLDIKRLKDLFVGKKKIYLEDVAVSVEDIAEKIDDEIITIDEKEFIVKVEEGEIFPIVSFSFENEKFGLRHSAYAKVNSNLLEGIKLRYFPVSLVRWDGSGWKEIGNEEHYRLYEDDFKDVKRATLISSFLREKCK